MQTETKWKPKLSWPPRKHWEEMFGSDYIGPRPSSDWNDYATPSELRAAVAALGKLRRRLHREGRGVERRLVMNLLQGLREDEYRGDHFKREELDQIDHLLPPAVLVILSRLSLTEQFADTVSGRCTDGAAWEAELRRRRLVEGGQA